MENSGIDHVYMVTRSWDDAIGPDQRSVQFVTETLAEATRWGTMSVRFRDGDGRVHVVETEGETT